jgi:RNA polymerase sigma-70 factor (ECF subfamily)
MFNANTLAASVADFDAELASPHVEPTEVRAVKHDAEDVPAASNDSMGSLIARELPKLKRLAWILVRDDDHANDLVQDTVVRVLTYAHSWQSGTNFGAWIRTVMRNQFYTECAQRSRGSKVIVQEETETLDAQVAAHQDDHLACEEMSKAIKQLPPNQRVALTLAAFEGLTSDEIAVRMKITPNAVRCHLKRGRQQLRLLAGTEVG